MELCSVFFFLVQLAACESVFEEVIVGCNNIIKLPSENNGILLNTCLQGDLFLSQNNRGKRREEQSGTFGSLALLQPNTLLAEAIFKFSNVEMLQLCIL